MATLPTGSITLALCMNPSIDYLLEVSSLKKDRKNAIHRLQKAYGGKGINAALVLGKLNTRVAVCGLLSKKDVKAVKNKLDRAGVGGAFTPINGRTRLNFKIMDLAKGRDTELNETGFPICPEDLGKLEETLAAELSHADWLILSGSLPPGVPVDFYKRMIQLAASFHVKTCLDASGQPLIEGIKARPALVHINHSELEELAGMCLNKSDQIIAAIKEVRNQGASVVVVSLGRKGALAYDGDHLYSVSVPKIQAIGLTGAGDAMTAGLVHGLKTGKSLPESLIFSSALASASTLKQEPGDFSFSDLDAVLVRTRLNEISF